MSTYRVIEGDCIAGMATLPERSVHCCISSPPYWGLRDYGTARWEGGVAGHEHQVEPGPVTERHRLCVCGARRVDGQIGLEETPEAYVARMVEVYRAVWRVLRDDGTCWVNLGDSYASGGLGRNDADRDIGGRGGNKLGSGNPGAQCRVSLASGTKHKDLVGIPWMVAFALRADGWYLRSDIIWSKPNPMPESVTDRPTKAHEYVFLLTKRDRYFYDSEAVKEEGATDPHSRGGVWTPSQTAGPMDRGGRSQYDAAEQDRVWAADGKRNRRTVWHIATQPYAEAHFATYPEKLVEPMVLAGTSERGCCAECGAPWRRVVEKRTVYRDRPNEYVKRGERDDRSMGNRINLTREGVDARTVGWEPTCTHGSATVPATVLDPFSGSGTTGVVACGHGRNYIGCELNPEYAAMSRRRIGGVNPLLVREAV